MADGHLDRIIERRNGSGEDVEDDVSFAAEEEDGTGSNPFTDPNQIKKIYMAKNNAARQETRNPNITPIKFRKK